MIMDDLNCRAVLYNGKIIGDVEITKIRDEDK